MSTDHRAEAERLLAIAASLGKDDDGDMPEAVGAAVHALLAIHDLLAERLPSALDGVAATDEPTAPDCDREHADEWVEVDEDTWDHLPDGVRLRQEWVRGDLGNTHSCLAHRDDLPDPDADLIERMAKAIFASNYPNLRWESMGEDAQEHYRRFARAALAAYREGER